MMISQINAVNCGLKNLSVRQNNENGPVKTKNQQNFKGLWGETKIDDYVTTDTIGQDVKYQYYPFKDETQREINAVIDKHSYHYDSPPSDKPKYVVDPMWETYTRTVVVRSALPFTSKDFVAYLENRVSDLKRVVIEKHILEKNLRKLP